MECGPRGYYVDWNMECGARGGRDGMLCTEHGMRASWVLCGLEHGMRGSWIEYGMVECRRWLGVRRLEVCWQHALDVAL
ncbi:hypothetical protein NDU88_002236 [Pleurodeles waltl]|uniref:Uncharacterized protein n=1 Tax=Pleurodeles waltl TaxID=8319 RepID=A0AAV7LJP3_PLEWA|nr:hypothetical protein NDU88_002236 [Pleurodeles waltl]